MNTVESVAVLIIPLLVVYVMLVAPLKVAGRHRHYNRFGYLDMPFEPPAKAFGSQRYTVRRDGNRGHFRGLVMSNNPHFYTRERILESREEEQDGAECAVCGRAAENDIRSDSGPVFREQWQSFHLFFLPVKRTYLGFEAYCDKHTPRDWEE